MLPVVTITRDHQETQRMSKTPNHQADIKNGNWGTNGTNKTWDKAQGNKGKQMDPNWTPPPAGSAGSANKRNGQKK